jgi:hypothetical protein
LLLYATFRVRLSLSRLGRNRMEEAMFSIVTAKQLELWSNTLDCRAELPGVVASLIRASCPSLQSYNFPHDDASQTHGFDGVADVLDGNVFVPKGRSIWEFGAGEHYKTKANGDYDKRTKALTPKERSTQTFIFVTSRIWDDGLEEWKKDRSTDGWLEVRLYDANYLDHWLGDYPSVAVPLARKLGIIPPSGVRTLDHFWDEYSLNFSPPLKEDLLLNGREARAKRLCEALIAGLPNLSKWQADSPEEAIAFIAAAIMKAETRTSLFLRAKTLVLETREAAEIVTTTNRLNFILPPAASRMGPALARTNQVVLALGSDDRADGSEVLEWMNTKDFAAGLKAMGMQDDEAFRLAGTCRRSPTVLSRLIPSGTATPPKWHDNPKLVPIVLAGGWDASNKDDIAIVERLCNTSYDSVDAEARRLESLSDAPLDLEGTVWTLRSHKDAFTLLGCLVDSGSQGRLREACLDVFSERDRTLDIPDEKRPVIPTRGDDFRHSEWLRRGLARTLLLMSGLHQAAKFKVIGSTPEEYVESVVGSIPGLSNDIRVLASLKHEFPLLVEAAPRPLAYALERVLGGDSREWAEVIFRDKQDDSIWSSFSPHTYLLWGLETMAWGPDYLHRAASSLLALAEFDPGGKLANRPLSSLREIFLAWRPNTYASLEERIAILRSICRRRPVVGLKLAMSLLPRGHDYSSPTAQPRLKDFGEAKSNAITSEDVREAYRQYADLTIELAGTDINRLLALVESLAQLEPQTRERAISAMRTGAKSANPDVVFQLWTKLNDFVQRHRNFHDADWALVPDQLRPLEGLCKEIEPRDPVRKILWLFDEFAPRAGPSSGQDYVAEANRDRRDAVGALLRDHDVSVVLDLAKATKNPHLVGYALAEATQDVDILRNAISLATTTGSGVDADFAMSLSGAAHVLRGKSWDDWIGQFAAGLDSATGASLFLRWEETRPTWDFVGALAPEIEREYWRRKRAFRPSSQDDAEFAFDKYVAVGRFSAIIEMVAYNETLLSTVKCMQALQGLASELSKEKWKLRQVHYEILRMIQALQQREDADIEHLAAIEYQYLPLLEFHAEPTALNRLLRKSPKLLVSVISDAFKPASGEKGEITDERRSRARLAYQVLQSMKTVPGFSEGAQDVGYLRSWITEVRKLAREADREVIADQQIGQILAYAPLDAEDAAWPARPIRELIEDLSSDQIESGIAICRFNQRGAFSKNIFDGGEQERGLASQYRKWAEAARQSLRTSALLRRIADDWDAHGKRADREAELDQLRHGQ